MNIFPFCQAQIASTSLDGELEGKSMVTIISTDPLIHSSDEGHFLGDSLSEITADEDFLHHLSGATMAQFTADQFDQLIHVLRPGTGPLKTESPKDLPHFRGKLT